MGDKFIIIGRNVMPCADNDTLEWARWYEKNGKDRVVGRDVVGDFEVSTVFLSIDHGFQPHPNDPLLFETMVFHGHTGMRDIVCERYRTYDDAEEGHRKMVARVKAGEIAVPSDTMIREHKEGQRGLERLTKKNQGK